MGDPVTPGLKEVLDGVQADGEHTCREIGVDHQTRDLTTARVAGPARYGLMDFRALQPGLQLEGSDLVALPLTLAEPAEPLTTRFLPPELNFLNAGEIAAFQLFPLSLKVTGKHSICSSNPSPGCMTCRLGGLSTTDGSQLCAGA